MPIMRFQMNDLIVVEKIAQWQKLKTLVLDSVTQQNRHAQEFALAQGS
jgi:hypothetical protein